MCGIVAASLTKPCTPYIFNGLRRLNHRGYDSWGVATRHNGNFVIRKGLGNFKQVFSPKYFPGNVGVGHVRWATTGKVCLENAHPILSDNESYAVVHNGIIDNHREIRQELVKEGILFKTYTDTEVIVNLFQSEMSKGSSFHYALAHIRKRLLGSYSFAILAKDCNMIGLVCNGSPLCVTLNGYAASEPYVFSDYSDEYYRMKDGETAILEDGQTLFYGIDGNMLEYQPGLTLVPKINEVGKQNFPHYMRSEIQEQVLPAKEIVIPDLQTPESITIFGCGSSYYAGLFGKYLFENLCKIPTRVEYSTELIHQPNLKERSSSWYIGITQSGETKDTVAALETIANNRYSPILITNNSNSNASKYSDYIIDLRCGEERGVAATKTFTATLRAMIGLAEAWDWTQSAIKLNGIEDKIKKVVDLEEDIKTLAITISAWGFHNILVLSDGIEYPIACEAALKLKEVAYKHAEAMYASEIKHGPIALIDDETLSIFLITTQDEARLTKILHNVEEIRARNGRIAIVTTTNFFEKVKDLADFDLVLPQVNEVYHQTIVTNVAMQLLAYHIALREGREIDCPRNLAKAVTV